MSQKKWEVTIDLPDILADTWEEACSNASDLLSSGRYDIDAAEIAGDSFLAGGRRPITLEITQIRVLDPESIRLALADALHREPTKAELAHIFNSCVTALRGDQELRQREDLIVADTVNDFAAWEVVEK